MSDATQRQSPAKGFDERAALSFPAGYAMDRVLLETPRFGVYLAYHEPVGSNDGAPRQVLVKMLRGGRSESELARLEVERKMFGSLRIRGVAGLDAGHSPAAGPSRAGGTGSRSSTNSGAHTDLPAIILEAVPGEPLGASIPFPLGVDAFLVVAVEMVAILGRLHAAGVMHKNVQPAAFLWDEAAGRVTLIDLGRATRLLRERPTLPTADVLDETLPYVSPEQTGRMNRGVDLRTDLYSLGVTFFQMLTGRLPFESADPLAIVHGHIARRPPRVETLAPRVPLVIGDIVAKLLEKSAEDRYQSAAGLLADLERCRRDLGRSGTIEPFTLALEDTSSLLRLSGKLYGREAEVAALLDAFERAAAGNSELVLVTGYSGIGKTALVREIHNPIAARRGNFVEGKFDLPHRNTPYSAWIAAFTGLVHYLLMDSDTELAESRRRIMEALGADARIVTDVIPDLTLVIGDPPAVPDLPPTEMQNRFQRVFGDFVRAVATDHHPLAIFLDDLQWADQGSLMLAESLLGDRTLEHVLLIGSYRDNEVDAQHPVSKSVKRIRAAGARCSSLKVRPLRVVEIGRLLADALHTTTEQTGELARLVHSKTDGNPFFVTELIGSLSASGLLEYRDGWRWDLDRIRRAPISDDVADLMVGKLEGLPETTMASLKVAACIGVEFDLELVARASGQTAAETVASLQPALHSGLIESSGRTGLFAHDRVTEAVYGLISLEESEELHHAVGQALLAEAAGEWPGELVFAIAEQMNAAGPRTTETERPVVIRANLEAARHARASAAHAAASRFYSKAAELLPEDAWETDYKATIELHTDWAEAAYAAMDYPKAEELFALVLARATTLADRIRVHVAEVDYHKAGMRFQDALNVVLMVLDEIGIPFLPLAEIDEAATEEQFARFRANLGDRRPLELADLPEAASPYREAIEVLATSNTLLWLAFPGAALYAVLQGANLMLEHGTCGAVAETVTLLGSLLCSKGQPELGTELGELGQLLLDRFGPSSSTELIYHNFVAFWKRPVRESREPLYAAYEEAIRLGDNLNAAYLINNHMNARLWSGDNLLVMAAGFDRLAGPFFRLNQPNTVVSYSCPRQTVQNLLGNAADPTRLEGEFWSEERELPELKRLKFHAGVGVVAAHRLLAQVILGDYEGAVRFLGDPEIEDGLRATTGLYDEIAAAALIAVAGLQCWREGDDSQRAAYLARAEATAERLRLAADHFPPNFLALHALVAAEIARVKEDTAAAIRFYHQAIAAARGQEFTHIEGLANELAASFWADQGRDTYARPHLAAAASAYRRWGARAKVDQLMSRDPWLATEAREPGERHPFDLKTVMKGSQAISREIELDRLLARLLQIAIENAGAQRGVFLLHSGDQLVVEAEATSDDPTAILSTTPLADRSDIPQSIVQFVARSGESVLLDDASREGAFISDPSIVARKPRSVMCLPISLQGSLVGVIYLENNLAAAAFGSDHEEVLKILCAQAAISIENARLYAERDGTLAALRESEEKYRALVENTADVVFAMNPQGVFTYVSPAMETLGGYAVDEIIGTSFTSLVVPQDLERATAALERALAGDAAPIEFRGVRKDGRVLTLRVSARPTRDADRVLGFNGILTDISERRALEEQLLQAMKMESIGRLAGGVAHDFNNLLTAILGNAELAMLDVPDGSASHEAIEEITKAGKRASTLTKQLLAFASKQIVAPVRLNLSTVVTESQKMLTRLLGENIEITTVVDPHLALIEADPGQMEQLLMNLTINARDAMPGGGRLVIETRNAMVEASPKRSANEVAAGRWVVLTVTDTGAGMEPDVLEHIFEPFFTTKGKGSGVGMGLATCHGIVNQNHGHIFVFSEPGLGSTFRIMLPVARAGAAAALGDVTPPTVIDGTETILVVEDEAMVRRLAVLGLRAHGYAVIEAPDGPTALAIASRPETTIDLVVSDVVMPGMSGPDLGRRLAELRPEAALILASGHAEAVILGERTGRGGARFLQKPFTPEQLARKVREVLDSPRPIPGDDS